MGINPNIRAHISNIYSARPQDLNQIRRGYDPAFKASIGSIYSSAATNVSSEVPFISHYIKDSNKLIIDLPRKKVLIADKDIKLTYKEYKILAYLIKNQGTTVHRDDIISEVFNMAANIPNERTIDVHISRIRQKLGKYCDIIIAIRSIGYRYDRRPDIIIHRG